MIVRWGYSRKPAMKKAARFGRADAIKGLDPAPELAEHQILGVEEVFEPERDETHARLREQSQPHPQLASWEAERQELKKRQTPYSSRWTQRIILAIAGIAEVTAMLELLKSLGMENPSRVAVAFAGSAILFVLTAWAEQE